MSSVLTLRSNIRPYHISGIIIGCHEASVADAYWHLTSSKHKYWARKQGIITHYKALYSVNNTWSWETYGGWIKSDFLQAVNVGHDAAVSLEAFSYHPSKRYPSKTRLNPICNYEMKFKNQLIWPGLPRSQKLMPRRTRTTTNILKTKGEMISCRKPPIKANQTLEKNIGQFFRQEQKGMVRFITS